jgi:hypothetical protein
MLGKNLEYSLQVLSKELKRCVYIRRKSRQLRILLRKKNLIFYYTYQFSLQRCRIPLLIYKRLVSRAPASGPGKEGKVEGSQLRLYKAKEGSRK